jgi:two-component system sensor histidine kinase KdpD
MSFGVEYRFEEKGGRTPAWLGYCLSVLMVGAASVVAVVVDHVIHIPNLSLVFVLPVVIAAVSFGWKPAMAAAAAAVVAEDYLLIDPRYTLSVADPANMWALGLLVVVAAIVSTVAAQSRRRTLEAFRAADQAMALQAMARAMTGAIDREAIAEAAAEALGRLFAAPAVVLIDDAGELALAAQAGGFALGAADREAARWMTGARLPTRAGAYPADAAVFDFWPVVTPQQRRCVIGVRFAGSEDGRPETADRLVEIVGGYLSVAIDRDEYARLALERRVQTTSERLKADLLAAVSHDLKTPLSTILLALQSLRKFSGAHGEAARAELLALAETETARLSGLVGKLLDMSRIDAGAVAPALVRAAPAELAAAALERVGPALDDRIVANQTSRRAPALLADPLLFETALAAVLENAAKYSAPGSAITIRGGSDEARGWIEVLDTGPGFEGSAEPLFEKFARGEEGDGRPPGTGLGLAIARGFLEAQGGGVTADNRRDHRGARVRLWLPLADRVAA